MENDAINALGHRIAALEEAAMRHPIATPAGLAAFAVVGREYALDRIGDDGWHADRFALAIFGRVQDFAVRQ